MDTKWKNIKRSLPVKILSVILSAALIFAGTAYMMMLVFACYLYGYDEFLTGSSITETFTQSDVFFNQFESDFNDLLTLMTDTDELEAELSEKAYADIDEITGEYLDEKAEIIENELIYAVSGYSDSFYSYEDDGDENATAALYIYEEDAYDAEVSDDTLSTTFANSEEASADTTSSAKYYVSNDAPETVKEAANVLNTKSGRELLDYEYLVRSDAFNESEFRYDYALESQFSTFDFTLELWDYTYDESSARTTLLSLISDAINIYIEDIDYYITEAWQNLYSKVNFVYYAENGETIYTNSEIELIKTELPKSGISIAYEKNAEAVCTVTGLDKTGIDYSDLLTASGNDIVYIYIDESFSGQDEYCYLQAAYTALKTQTANELMIKGSVCFLFAIILFIVFICLCGYKKGCDEPVTALIDKFPNDIHFIISFFLIALGVFVPIIIYRCFAANCIHFRLQTALAALAASAGWLFFAEWTASAARYVKTKKSWGRNTLIYKFGRLIAKVAKGFYNILKYKPSKFGRTALIAIIIYFVINVVLCFLAFTSSYIGIIPLLLGVFIMLVFNGLCAVFVIKYAKNLDKIIIASENHTAIELDNEKLPESLKILADSLNNFNLELNRAVEQAVKDEQTKTELITNVSHDLKTPLTSLISYSDLLSKCNIEDETAKKYIGVINEQSIKLKRLIEDLIEASKVSTGNISLNKTALNLSELSVQIIVEFTPEMEKNGNEIRFSEPVSSPIIYADGSKTYRILSNLLNNAKKYSAPNTRIYITIYNDSEYGYFEIKNISNEPLNISPNELTERFVRGEKSRTKEGNGLGLSIAKDLCKLQNGKLNITIDGDLFKAVVALPMNKTESQSSDGSEDKNKNPAE
ncbi:MAG: HAMP domain-containing histidine kinase [Clostridiales bacterium]|nr:HAMP domain-containing histidine kinase [Clostridiales bacterium]